MSWSDRRTLLIGLAALAGCGFEPAYAPDGVAYDLRGLISIAAPEDEQGWALVRRLEERLGDEAGPYILTADIFLDEEAVGFLPDGTITRYTVQGAVQWRLLDGDRELARGEERSFTGYSATSTTVATIFARRDAEERLTTILADRVVADLIRTAPDWRP